MTESSSATEVARDGWSVNDRGYIQGGFDTPIVLQAKQRFNSQRTERRHQEKRKEHEKLIDRAIPLLIDAQRRLKPFYFRPSETFVQSVGHEPIIKE